MDPAIWQPLGIALGLGFLLGLQREWAKSSGAGIPTFPLITVLGTTCALLGDAYGGWVLGSGLLAVAALLVVMNVARREEQDEPDPRTKETFIADGYRNRRVVVYDAASGEYLRHWGAYGKPPDDAYEYPVDVDSPPQQYSTLHGIVGTKDGLIYVADRRGNCIQVFRQNGEYLMERFVRPETGGSGSGFSLQLSRDPEQSLLYLMDGTNQRVWILRRRDLQILDRFGKPGRQAGEFIRAHMIAVDSQNRMYTGEQAMGGGCSGGSSEGRSLRRVSY